ncbi:MAG: hypothetical protein U0354_08590 [Candidatus Sericytochromatia bacterium]
MCLFVDMNNIFNNLSVQKDIKEANICKVKKEDNKPLDDVFGKDLSPNSDGIKSPSKEFIDFMSISAKKSSEKISNKINQLTTALPFVDSTNNGNIKANLKIDLRDKNGFVDSGEQDLSIKLNGNINIKKDAFFQSLKSLEGKSVERSWKADVDIGKVSFDPKAQAYKIQLKIDGFAFFNDDIDLIIKPDKNNNLVISVDEKWLPDLLQSDSDILNKVQNKIAKELKKENFGLNTVIKDGKLMFLTKVENREIKINSKESIRIDKTNLDFENVKFNIDKDGNIDMNFKDLKITASNLQKDEKGNQVNEKTSSDPDFASFDISADINTKGSKK